MLCVGGIESGTRTEQGRMIFQSYLFSLPGWITSFFDFSAASHQPPGKHLQIKDTDKRVKNVSHSNLDKESAACPSQRSEPHL